MTIHSKSCDPRSRTLPSLCLVCVPTAIRISDTIQPHESHVHRVSSFNGFFRLPYSASEHCKGLQDKCRNRAWLVKNSPPGRFAKMKSLLFTLRSTEITPQEVRNRTPSKSPVSVAWSWSLLALVLRHGRTRTPFGSKAFKTHWLLAPETDITVAGKRHSMMDDEGPMLSSRRDRRAGHPAPGRLPRHAAWFRKYLNSQN